ncbi:MAG TPA: BT_3928 family protein [Flavisolibacter sp.]|nr:BT_3928 family protein [Flavisolibacter sp.]
MKSVVRIVQIIVGVLFIISGLVKANDPLGLAYKMEEFFELWNSDLAKGSFFLKNPLISLFQFLHSHTLALSITMITLEIVAGVALLITWKKKFVLYLLLILMFFFTFLTGYAYLSGKFTNCGCFGDCLPITPLTSFIKDLVLLVFIMFLIIGQSFLRSALSYKTRNIILLSSLIFSLVLQWYVLNYLPIVDCLPFKEKNNIAEKMKAPPGSVPDSIAIRFIYEKDGKRFEFAPESLPEDFTTYKYIDRIDKLIRKGNAEPAIKSFSLMSNEIDQQTGNKVDSTPIILQQPTAIMVFFLDFSGEKWIEGFKQLLAAAKQKELAIYVLSASANEGMKIFDQNGIKGNVQFFNTDFTVVRTAARTNPTVYILKKGTILKKYSEEELAAAATDIDDGKF